MLLFISIVTLNVSVINGKFVFNWFFACKINKSPCIIFVTFDFRSSTRTCIVSAFSYKIIHINSEYNVIGKDQNQLLNALKCSQDYLLPLQIASNYSKFKSIGCICFITKSVQTHHSRLCSVCTKGVWGNSKCTCFLPCNLHLFRLQSQSGQLHPSSVIVSGISLFLLTQVTVCIYVTWSLHL